MGILRSARHRENASYEDRDSPRILWNSCTWLAPAPGPAGAEAPLLALGPVDPPSRLQTTLTGYAATDVGGFRPREGALPSHARNKKWHPRPRAPALTRPWATRLASPLSDMRAA